MLAGALSARAAADQSPSIRVVAPARAAPAEMFASADGARRVEVPEAATASYRQAAPAEPPIALGQPAAVSAADAAEPEPIPVGTAQRRQFRPITRLTADASLPPGLLPEQVERPAEEGASLATPLVGDLRLMNGWGGSAFEWSATGLCHAPLYFEEVNLERFGYQCHPLVQPFVSGAHFFLTVPTLPYQMTVHPPRECIYTLGHYRPGSRAPWQRQRLPWDARAAVVEAGVAVGLVFLIP